MGRLPCHPLRPLSKAISAPLRPLSPSGDRRVSIPVHLTARRSPALSGRVWAPGDKSISHRALILGAMATGVTDIDGLLEGDDILATALTLSQGGTVPDAEDAFQVEARQMGQGRVALTLIIAPGTAPEFLALALVLSTAISPPTWMPG